MASYIGARPEGLVLNGDIADDAVTSAKIDSTSTGMALADLTVDTSTLVVDATNNRVNIGTATGVSGYQLRVANNSGNVQTLLTAGTNFNSTIDFGDQDANNTGEIKYAHNGDFMAFNTNGAEAVKIDSSKRVQIGNVDASATTSAKNNAILTIVDTGSANPMARIAFDSGDSDVTNGVNIGYTAATFAPDFEIANGDAGIIRFSTSNTECARFTSGGDLFLNTTGAVGSGNPRLSIDNGSDGVCVATERSGTSSVAHFQFINGNGTVGSISTSGS